MDPKDLSQQHFTQASNGTQTMTFRLDRALNPPVDLKHVDILHGIAVPDPFRPMENYKSDEVAAWADRQHKRFEEFIAGTEAVQDSVVSFMKGAIPDGTYESMPYQTGGRFHVWRKDKDAQRYSLYIKDVPDYGAPARLLLDPAVIDPSGKTNIPQVFFTRDGKTMGYTLSVAGSDRTTLKFMDVDSGTELPLVYEDFLFGIEWDEDGQGFHYMKKLEENLSYEVCYHKMGTDPANDAVIYTPRTGETMVWHSALFRDSTRQMSRYELVYERYTEPDKNAVMIRECGSAAPYTTLFPRSEGTLTVLHEMGGKLYGITTRDAKNGRVVRIDPADPAPEKWETIIPENPEDPLMGAEIWRGNLVAYYSHDTGDKVSVYTPDGAYRHDMPIPSLSSITFAGNFPDDTHAYFKMNNFQEEGTVYRYDIDTNAVSLFRESDTPINLRDCVVERHYPVSKDGTRIPMTIIHTPAFVKDGTGAGQLYGYGGFEVSLTPGFSSYIASYVRAGGVYAQANLRGGGEKGQSWYDAGRLQNKQNVFDDMAACAEYLIEKGYTSAKPGAKRLCIRGGSNGGLLTLAVVLQRPELFGAVISEVPVADMTRFHIGSEFGYGWKSDYGDPDRAEDLKVQLSYSPLHNVTDDFVHPPILVKPDMTDVRVLPWHSFKVTAMLQAKEHPDSQTYMCVLRDGGHGGGMTQDQRFRNYGLIDAFLTRTLGPINQIEYRAQLAAAAKPAPAP